MAGICQACKKVADLTGCSACGARVCFTCVGRNGCKVCQGMKLMK